MSLATPEDQAHQLVATVLLIALVAEIHLVRFHRVVVFIEPKQIRLFVVLIIGNEQIGSVSDEQPLGIEQAETVNSAALRG